MSPCKFFLFVFFIFLIFLYSYVYFLFQPFPFYKTSKERAFSILEEANVSYEDIIELFARCPLDQEKIEKYLALNNEDVYQLLATNPSLSKSDFQFLWKTSFSLKRGQNIRLSLICYQKLESQEVERILNGNFDYNLWSSLAQNIFLSEEKFKKMLFLTPENFKESMIRLNKISKDRTR